MNHCSNIETEITADGSATLLVKELDEHYHSIKGAITESRHIFRDCAFIHRSNGKPLRLLEIGFGTGLNAVVTALAADAEHPIHYITLEKYPVEPQLIAQLGYEHLTDKAIFDAIQHAEWDTPTAITPYFTLEKRKADYLSDTLPDNIDIVYFDAFAPEKQPEMWSAQAFTRLYKSMNNSAVLTTYCSKGSIRRLLIEIGFTVERLPGPAGGKREILRATKNAL